MAPSSGEMQQQQDGHLPGVGFGIIQKILCLPLLICVLVGPTNIGPTVQDILQRMVAIWLAHLSCTVGLLCFKIYCRLSKTGLHVY